jgi:hypothetical protein
MEYLMTYGWAVLIIAVVLAVLYSLGLFNSTAFGPRASPGSCKLFKSTAMTTLEGVCNNVMPQSVAQFNGAASVLVPNAANLNPNTQVSVSAWVYVNSYASTTANGIVTKDISGSITNPTYGLQMNSGAFTFIATNSLNGDQLITGGTVSTNTWYFVAGTYNNGLLTLYVNGANAGTSSLPGGGSIASTTGYLNIGMQKATAAPGRFLNGQIADVQIYNTSLDANQVQALYTEGIGGVPVNLQHIVGWWPLNGDFNDYSGNGNAGTPTSVIFASSWTSGYTTP